MSDLWKQLSYGKVYLCWGVGGNMTCMVLKKTFSTCFIIQL